MTCVTPDADVILSPKYYSHTQRKAYILNSSSLFLTHKVTTYFHCKIQGCDASIVCGGALLRIYVSAATCTCPLNLKLPAVRK